MEQELLKSLGQIAGLAGIVSGIALILFRQIIQKQFFSSLTKKHSYRIILTITIAVWTIALAGIGAWAYVEINGKKPIETTSEVSLDSFKLPINTGWVFVGYFDIDKEFWTEGPYISIIETNSRGQRNYVEKGDIVQMKVSSDLIVNNYKNSGMSQAFVSPVQDEHLNPADYTDFKVPTNSKWLVRDVQEGSWIGSPQAGMWIRIVDIPE
ncbi:hypothetical protein [Winogradskyella sp.]|uniref:hypothetical protein n=1 Tax=Winogradskyella sp. TaxID=1883156 RepID=UPI00262B8877|nr:hypothetical protein [Winogradskyella sp.]